MSDLSFRSQTETTESKSERVSEFVENKVGADTSPEPLEGESLNDAVLSTIGLGDNFHDLPAEEQGDVKEITNFLQDLIKAKGKVVSTNSLLKEMELVKSEMGLDVDTDPIQVINRVAGVIKAYKNISFLDGAERRSVFMKLAKMPDSKSMNKLVYELMENKKVWI